MRRYLVEEVNAEVYSSNEQELDDCFDKGLASDGGEYWVLGNRIVDALTDAGYILIKTK